MENYNTKEYKNHYNDCECSDCLGLTIKTKSEHFMINSMLILTLCIISYFFGYYWCYRTFWNRPYTVNERQTWFRENGYLNLNNEKNFDGKCGKLLHKAEENALFWNYQDMTK